MSPMTFCPEGSSDFDGRCAKGGCVYLKFGFWRSSSMRVALASCTSLRLLRRVQVLAYGSRSRLPQDVFEVHILGRFISTATLLL